MIADIVLVLLLFLFAFWGLKKGFMSSILSFAGLALSFVIAVLFANKLAVMLEGTAIYNFISDMAAGMLNGVGDFMATSIPSYDVLYDALSAKLPDFLAKILADSASAMIGSSADMTIAELLMPSLVSMFMTITSFIMLFIGSYILTIIIKAIVSAITSLPIIHLADKLLGFILGLIKGFVFVSVLFLIMSFLGGLSFVETINVYINDSYLASYMYNNNIILLIVQYIFP